MGKGLNRVRYAYFCSHDFYYFLGALLGMAAGCAVAACVAKTPVTPVALGVVFSVAPLAGATLAWLVSRTFFNTRPGPRLRATATGCLASASSAVGVWLLASCAAGGRVLVALGVLGISTPTVAAVFFFKRAERIKIYPDRVTVGKLVLHYEDMLGVEWGLGSLDEYRSRLDAGRKRKDFEVLTPVLYESSGKDFTIYHHYAVVETEDALFVIQPVFWRNSLAQNLRNAWLEGWRWDGSTTPPDDWIPHQKYRSQ
ncbi:MAG: hypothetical protein ACTSU5_08715 [Promethearchaeota archaeon]